MFERQKKLKIDNFKHIKNIKHIIYVEHLEKRLVRYF